MQNQNRSGRYNYLTTFTKKCLKYNVHLAAKVIIFKASYVTLPAYITIMMMNDETCFEINISSKETQHTLHCK